MHINKLIKNINVYEIFCYIIIYLFQYKFYTESILKKGDYLMGLFDKENTKPFLTEIENRRTIYKTKTSISISDEELEEMIEHIVKYMPSAFNSQSTRIVLLLNDQHIKFWENAKTVLKDVMGPDRDFEPTNQRINGFEHAYGTILYFEDEDVIKSLQEQMPSYADNFANWAVQTNAMYQYAIWTALSSKGIGASLQHYNPLVDQITAQTFDIPASWKLVAQMPFGDIEEQAGEKEIHPTDQRFIIKK